MLNEVMTSTKFVNDLNGEIAKLKTPLKAGLIANRQDESRAARAMADREAITQRVRDLVARLDSSESRIASLRSRVATLSKHDDQLTQQVALYEKTIADLRDAAERQRAELQSVIDDQNLKITALNSDNVRLAGEKTALTDTVRGLTVEKNTAYYVAGTRDELLKKGVLVEEGHKSFLGILGSRPIAPARALNPAQFVKIDRLKNVTIPLPDGEYSIVTRQDLDFATPAAKKDDRIRGSLTVDSPEKFWEPSKFLVLVRH
jgi:hypothetical protein